MPPFVLTLSKYLILLTLQSMMLPLATYMFGFVAFALSISLCLVVDFLPCFRKFRFHGSIEKGAEEEARSLWGSLTCVKMKILLLLSDRLMQTTFTALVKDLSVFFSADGVSEDGELSGMESEKKLPWYKRMCRKSAKHDRYDTADVELGLDEDRVLDKVSDEESDSGLPGTEADGELYFY